MTGFLKNTITGGLLFLVPIGALIIILAKIVPIAQKVTDPLTEIIPIESIAGLKMPVLLTSLLILLICFVAGLLANTRAANRLVAGLEDTLLEKIPGYSLLKSMGEDLVSIEGSSTNQVVLVRFDDAWQFGLKVDNISNGKQTAVFIPDSPTPQTGGLFVVDSSRVQSTDLSINQVLVCLKNRGTGVHKLLEGDALT